MSEVGMETEVGKEVGTVVEPQEGGSVTSVELGESVTKEGKGKKAKRDKGSVEEKLDPGASQSEKMQRLEKARGEIEKQFGKGALIRMDDTSLTEVEFLSTNLLGLDDALGGGFGKGRIIEIYGPESSGKSSLALHAIAQAQKKGGVAAYIDIENSIDTTYAKNLGVDLDHFWLSQPDSGEQALSIAENLIRSGGVDIIVIDSVAALVPQAEIDGEMGDSHMGLTARLMGQFLRVSNGIVKKNNVILIFINQLRMKLGVMFGNPECVTPDCLIEVQT